jgi:hypothetical protein
MPESLENKLELWKNRLPISEDFNGDSRYILFSEDHHLMVLHGLGLFNSSSIKKEFEMHDILIKLDAENIIRNNKLNEDTVARVSHKQYLLEIKNGR